jgi:hypothetical protein
MIGNYTDGQTETHAQHFFWQYIHNDINNMLQRHTYLNLTNTYETALTMPWPSHVMHYKTAVTHLDTGRYTRHQTTRPSFIYTVLLFDFTYCYLLSNLYLYVGSRN